jgi:hypothetical protein
MSTRSVLVLRQLTQYENYALRLLRDAGIPTAAPHGIVEITPEREYLLVTEFFTGAVEIGTADIDDDIIDQGPAAHQEAVGCRHRAPGHQAGEPHGP